MIEVIQLEEGDGEPVEPPFLLLTQRSALNSPEWTFVWRYWFEGKEMGGSWDLPFRSEEQALEVARDVAAERGIERIFIRRI